VGEGIHVGVTPEVKCCNPDRNPCDEHWRELVEAIGRLAVAKEARPVVAATGTGGLCISFEAKD
jgi:hypothetical protein